MAITLQDIADHLQLSQGTVSRALNNDPMIRPKTRAKVHAAAMRLGYECRPRSTRRRSGASKQGGQSTPQDTQAASGTATLGLLIPAAGLDHARQDPNLVQIMQGVMTESEHTGMMLMVHTIQPGDRERMEENPAEVPPMIRERGCQTVIVRGAFHPDDVAFLSGMLPVVSIGRVYRELPVDAVVAESAYGIHALVTRLVDLGHRKLAWVGGHYEATFLDERHDGFVQGCLRNGLDLGKQRFFEREIYEARRIRVPDKLLQAVRAGTTAMVCGNDSIALQVIEALESCGLRVPQDVSVTGFDAVQAINNGRRITSVDPRFVEQGRAAVRLATQRLTQRPTPPCIVTVRSEFVLGDTIAAGAISSEV
jgi:LacI family transcriptional regulator